MMMMMMMMKKTKKKKKKKKKKIERKGLTRNVAIFIDCEQYALLLHLLYPAPDVVAISSRSINSQR